MIKLEMDRDGAVMQHGQGDQKAAVEKIANLVGLTVFCSPTMPNNAVHRAPEQ